jgi:FtsP/CotA-like multicopper oxidase with cupredoxin domain
VKVIEEGEMLEVQALRYDRMTIGRRGTESFATLRVGPEEPSLAVIPTRLRDVPALAQLDAVPNRTVKMSVQPSLRRGMDFLVNGERHHQDRPVRVGEPQVWDIVNKSLMAHPFHLHGFFFQVLSVNGGTGKQPADRSGHRSVNFSGLKRSGPENSRSIRVVCGVGSNRLSL